MKRGRLHFFSSKYPVNVDAKIYFPRCSFVASKDGVLPDNEVRIVSKLYSYLKLTLAPEFVLSEKTAVRIFCLTRQTDLNSINL